MGGSDANRRGGGARRRRQRDRPPDFLIYLSPIFF